MKKHIIAVLFALSACTVAEKQPQDPRKVAIKRVDSLENEIKKAIANNPTETDIKLAMYTLEAYQFFVIDYPKDSLAPSYLFKGAQLYEGALRDKVKALEWYQQIYAQYPESKVRPMALFHKGNVLQEIGDTTNAIKSFKTFMVKYPQHPFAKDAENMITYIRSKNNPLKTN
jgi:outer membrane protein assembly factor BamD (BamD/ComL family)